MRRQKVVARSIYYEAGREKDDEKRKSVASWARASESKRARSNMVALAQSEPGVSINPDKLDADPWLLNVENGAIDLRTGQLREHRRENLITKLVPVEYDPQAACPIFDRFLSEVQPEEANRLYLQRWAGYSATGSTREERLSIWYGSGANGKTTLARAIQDRLGAYAKQIDPDVLMQSKYGQHPTGRASLFGVRAVFASETGDGQALAEKLVKSISSRDIMEARFIGENYFTWVPTHSLAILTNHKPEIQGTDNGIWRRIDLLPWTVTIPDDRKDPDLLDKLATEAAGILAWIVEGAADWHAHGLTRPAAIVEATAAYREDMDILGAFLADCCVIDRKASASVKDLYTEYQKWALTNGEEPIGKKDFGKRLDVRDLHRRGLLSAGTLFSWARQSGGRPTGDIRIRVCVDRLELTYRYRTNGGPWQDVREAAPLAWTPCHYGGRRPWLQCPGCGRRVAVIASDGRLFLCRHCYRLAYRSQQEVKIDRLMRKADKLRARLDGEPYGGSYLVKPKWMRWKTYERLQERIDDTEAGMWRELARRLPLPRLTPSINRLLDKGPRRSRRLPP